MDKIRANGNMVLSEKQKKSMIKKIAKKMEGILDTLHFDRENDYNLKETPTRVAKMWVNEMFTGCYDEPPKITTFPNAAGGQLIMVEDIKVKSCCSHHFQNIVGRCDIGIVYDKEVAGLSKFARIVDWYSRRPQIQEELTNQVLNHIFDTIKPKFVIVRIKGQHGCISQRGAENEQSEMTTCIFKTNREWSTFQGTWIDLFYMNLRGGK